MIQEEENNHGISCLHWHRGSSRGTFTITQRSSVSDLSTWRRNPTQCRHSIQFKIINFQHNVYIHKLVCTRRVEKGASRSLQDIGYVGSFLILFKGGSNRSV